MGKKTKKVIMFIVEGPTDEDTLSPVIKRLFKITVCLLNGEDENLLNMEPGDITVFDDAAENAEYSVGVSADVEPYTGIALMIYNGSEITYPPGTVIHECS